MQDFTFGDSFASFLNAPAQGDAPVAPKKSPEVIKLNGAPFRWNPLDKTNYKKGFAPTFGKEVSDFWSLLYGTKPTALNIFSAGFKAIKSSADATNDENGKKFTKPMLQLLGYKVRAGLLDYSPFALGRGLDQLGRRINVLTRPGFALAKWMFFPITLPLYIVAKTINLAKGVVASLITLVALPFLAIKYSAQSKKRDAAAQSIAISVSDARDSKNHNKLPSLSDIASGLGASFNRARTGGTSNPNHPTIVGPRFEELPNDYSL